MPHLLDVGHEVVGHANWVLADLSCNSHQKGSASKGATSLSSTTRKGYKFDNAVPNDWGN